MNNKVFVTWATTVVDYCDWKNIELVVNYVGEEENHVCQKSDRK